jgi:predicted ATPase
VGRERELAVLHDLLQHVEDGQGRVVGPVGEPGIGKSRLLMEFHDSVRGRPVTYLAGHCLSYGHTVPYLPVRDLVRAQCGISEADTLEAMTAKVRCGLQDVGMDADEAAPYLFRLLGLQEGVEPLAGLTSEAIKVRTFELLCQMSRRASQHQPLIIGVEDLHWIDATSEALFAALVKSILGASILYLATYRCGYRPLWVDKSYTTQMALHQLSPQESQTVVHTVAQREPPAEALLQTILTKAEGNPLFLEELTRALLEQDAQLADMPVPETIQGVLMARIDRLSDATKRVIQTASVLGREGAVQLLERLWDGPGDLTPHLQTLKRLEFLSI